MEHLATFGLQRDPFANEPQYSPYFEWDGHLDAERRLKRAVAQGKGLCVMTGAGGVGKTMLVRHLLESLEEEVYEACMLVPVPGVSDSHWILDRFARQLGVEKPAEGPSELLGQLYEQLAIVREDGRTTVLFLDEAQVLAEQGQLAALRGLLNLEYEDRRLLSVVLVGLPSLGEALVSAELADRVDQRISLRPFDGQTASNYLLHRIRSVNGNPAVLESAAVQALIKFSEGVPRRLNTLTDNALFEAHLAGRHCVAPSDVERAAEELGFETAPSAAAEPEAQAEPEAAVAAAPLSVAPVFADPVAEAPSAIPPAPANEEPPVMAAASLVEAEPPVPPAPVFEPAPPTPAAAPEAAEIQLAPAALPAEPFAPAAPEPIVAAPLDAPSPEPMEVAAPAILPEPIVAAPAAVEAPPAPVAVAPPAAQAPFVTPVAEMPPVTPPPSPQAVPIAPAPVSAAPPPRPVSPPQPAPAPAQLAPPEPEIDEVVAAETDPGFQTPPAAAAPAPAPLRAAPAVPAAPAAAPPAADALGFLPEDGAEGDLDDLFTDLVDD